MSSRASLHSLAEDVRESCRVAVVVAPLHEERPEDVVGRVDLDQIVDRHFESVEGVPEWKKTNMSAWRRLFEFVLEVYGKPSSVYGQVYADEDLEIRLHGQSGGVEAIRVSNRNPVVIYGSKGDVVRTHGEFMYLRESVLALVRGATQE